MINRRLPYLTMFFIVVVYYLFKVTYNGTFEPRNVMTVIAILGFLTALAVNVIIEKVLNRNKEAHDE
jgi:hypothetical protein